MDEFALIDRFFTPLGVSPDGVVLGIGDDAAVLEIPVDEQIVVTTDTQVETVHFPAGAEPADVARRSCAAALSDIAAMGARARWVSLALTLPDNDETWLGAFAAATAAVLEDAGACLIGGDTTSGPLCVSWHIIGTVRRGTALRRDGAKPGDAVYVSGTLGGASAALAWLDGGPGGDASDIDALVERYRAPRARLALGTALGGIASACIDVSDGLVADAAHLARRSGCGIRITRAALPLQPALIRLVGRERAVGFALGGGDDYELCFTVPPAHENRLEDVAAATGVGLTRIGRVSGADGVVVEDEHGREIPLTHTGYRHFGS